MELLELQELDHGSWTVVQARGEVDVASSPALGHALETVGEQRRDVVVDLSGVTFIDSTGLGVLVQALNGANAAERRLRLVISDPNVRRVFEVTALDGVFSIHGSLDAAAADLG